MTLSTEWQGRARPIGDRLAQSYRRQLEELEGLTLPPVPLRQPTKEIVIEGCLGDAAINRYWGAFTDHLDFNRIKLWGVDMYDPDALGVSPASESEKRKDERIQQHMIRMKEKGVVYLNKGNERDLKIYNNLAVDAVIVATWDSTHCDVAENWLGRSKWIFIEKPLDSSLDQIEGFKTAIQAYGGEVYPLAFDHYRTKALPLRALIGSVLGWLEGAPAKVTFFLLESELIEDQGRVRALEKGLIFDLFPHFLSLLLYLGDPNTFRLKGPDSLKVGRYSGTEIPKETFAALEFTFESYCDGSLVEGEAYIGKGVKGVRRLYRAGQFIESAPPKMLEIRGRNGRVIRLDFHKNTNTLSIEQANDEQSIAGLIDPPHNMLIDSYVLDRLPYDHSCFGIDAGEVIVRKIDEIVNQVPEDIPFYDPDTYLEDITRTLGVTFGFG